MRKKYKVKVKIIKLGFIRDDDDDRDEEDDQKAMAVEVKWEGEYGSGFDPFNLGKRKRKDLTREAILTRKKTAANDTVEWDDEEFENVCNFGSGSWQVCFSVLYRRRKKKKMAVIGRSRLDLSEIAGKKKKKKDDLHEFEEKVLMNLKFGGMYTQANLLVRFDFEEIIDGPELIEPGSRPDQITLYKAKAKSRSSETQFEPAKKIMSFFSWKKRRLSFTPTRALAQRECIDTGSPFPVEPAIFGSPQQVQNEENTGKWETKDLTSRDGKATLKTSVFFASFDQCSNKAAGESACTALVAVISHWLQTNPNSMPTRPEFNLLIQEGSSEWRKLCENDTFTQSFPNRHFDLETVLHSGVKPVAISRGDSFVGFFSPEKFESLKGAMSFEEIWDGIEDHHEPRIYIVSWNDHFFVLKVEENACYIIDTLGERLFEGCNQAFILRFDESSLMFDEEMEIMSKGKDCCKEFIKRFLAAIPIKELEEEEERKGDVSYFSLHHQLQIEFNCTYLLPSSAKSSPFSSSSSNSSASSSSSIDDG